MRVAVLLPVITLIVFLNLAAALACAGADDEATGVNEPITENDNVADSGSSGQAVLLFSIGMHIEPRGAQVSDIVAGGTPPRLTPQREDYYNNPELYGMHRSDILAVAGVVESHGGRMTIQAQTPFTEVAALSGDTILADLAARGHELGLHFHEDAHLGKNSESLQPETWCTVMQEEIDWIKQAGGIDEVRYWSGGNLYPSVLDAAACAGLDVYSDWKNPDDQSTPMELQGVNPWRPSGGTDGNDTTAVSNHDPDGPVVFLPQGIFDREDMGSIHRSTRNDDDAFFEYLTTSLMDSLESADTGKVNVFHFTVHPGQYKGDPADAFAVIDRFLAEVVDPLVASGQLQWATYSEMADAYAKWEEADGEDQ